MSATSAQGDHIKSPRIAEIRSTCFILHCAKQFAVRGTFSPRFCDISGL